MPYTMARAPVEPTPVQAETLFVRTTYDLEGHALTLNAFSRPGLAVWDQCIDPVGKCAGVLTFPPILLHSESEDRVSTCASF